MIEGSCFSDKTVHRQVHRQGRDHRMVRGDGIEPCQEVTFCASGHNDGPCGQVDSMAGIFRPWCCTMDVSCLKIDGGVMSWAWPRISAIAGRQAGGRAAMQGHSKTKRVRMGQGSRESSSIPRDRQFDNHAPEYIKSYFIKEKKKIRYKKKICFGPRAQSLSSQKGVANSSNGDTIRVAARRHRRRMER